MMKTKRELLLPLLKLLKLLLLLFAQQITKSACWLVLAMSRPILSQRVSQSVNLSLFGRLSFTVFIISRQLDSQVIIR